MNPVNRPQFLSPFSRLLISFIFIAGGLSKIANWDQSAGYMVSKNVIWVPTLLTLAIIVEVIGGLCVLFGYKARAASAILFLYLIPVTLIFHDFWMYQGMEAQTQLVNFMKNLAIMGGLLGVAIHGAGAYSVDLGTGKTKPSESDQARLRRVA